MSITQFLIIYALCFLSLQFFSYRCVFCFFFFFFFQAEDGIRDLTVTGVQTCALPILAIGTQVLDRMKTAGDAEAEGIAIGVEMVKALKALPGVRGVHLYAIE